MLIYFTILYLVASLPLLFGLFCGYRNRHFSNVSRVLISLMLLAASVVAFVTVFTCPPVFSEKISNVLLLLGGIVSSVMGLTFLLTSQLRFRLLVLLIAGLCLFEVAILAVVDHQFRIVVQDSNGAPVDIKGSEIELRHAPTFWGATTFLRSEGTHLKKGEIYFGLLEWLRCKDEWRFYSNIHNSELSQPEDLKGKQATWSEWPKQVVVK